MLNLDRKINRDTVFLAVENDALDGWLSKINRKIKKLVKKVDPVFSKVSRKLPGYKQIKKLGSKYRKVLKKIGAIMAVAVAVYFMGPAALKFVSSMGGKALASKAGSKLVQMGVKKIIQKKLSKKQRKKMESMAKTMTPAQMMTDPEFAAIAKEIAMINAANEATEKNKSAAMLMAGEGATDVEHQISKVAPPIPFLRQPVAKVAIPVGIGLLAFLL